MTSFSPLELPLEDIKQLEPAILGTDQPGLHVVSPEHLLFSIGVSLRRIADALEKQEVTITIPDTLHGQITNMAWEAGQSFKSGNGR